MSEAEVEPPMFAVVKGDPTAEEIAALVVVLSHRTATTSAPPGRSEVSGWSAYARAIRAPLQPGPGAWRRSGRA